jgi:hypothetical protein
LTETLLVDEFFVSTLFGFSDVRRFVEGERVFLNLSNMDLNEPLASTSMISSGDDEDEDSCCVRGVDNVS